MLFRRVRAAGARAAASSRRAGVRRIVPCDVCRPGPTRPCDPAWPCATRSVGPVACAWRVHRAGWASVGRRAGRRIAACRTGGGGPGAHDPRIAELTGMRRGELLWRRLCGRSVGAAVEADISHSGVVDHGLVIGLVMWTLPKIVHRSVVAEHAAPPKAAGVAHTGIAKSVIDAAIKANVRTPIARVPGVDAVVPTPIAWRPKQAHRRRLYPRPRHPVVRPRPRNRASRYSPGRELAADLDRQNGRSSGDRDQLRRCVRYASNRCDQEQAQGAADETHDSPQWRAGAPPTGSANGASRRID
jgi:hypothetical protein